MHDPMTVAHEIYLGSKKKRNGHYKSPLVTIWHVDPEKNSLGCRDDDSCGWFAPPYLQEEYDAMQKVAKRQYEEIFAKKVAYEKEKDYAYVCYNQDCYGAIYWSWRAIKAMNKSGWQYGKILSAKELDEIYKLATNPVDNFQSNYNSIKKYKDFERFFYLVWRAFRRFHRPWYKHPRWHIHHWKITFPIFRNFYRRYFQKCSICGKAGFGNSAAYGNWEGTKVWCEKCNADSIKASPVPK